jgi:hypothetical protein
MRRRHSRGETLIEGMMAMAVFSVGVIGLLQMNILASNQSGLARRQTVATAIARDLIDAFERIPVTHTFLTASQTFPITNRDELMKFVDIDNQTGLRLLAKETLMAGDRPLMGSARMLMDDAPGTYEVGWRVATLPDPTNPGLPAGRIIAVMVRFPAGAGKKTISFWTVKSNPSIVLGPDAWNLEM